jgi:hypothetical protein
MTNDRPWRLADLKFVPSGNGREKATINGSGRLPRGSARGSTRRLAGTAAIP